MMLRVAPSLVEGTIVAPPSKSYTHRAFIMGYLTRGATRIERALLGADTRATLGAVEALGGRVDVRGGVVAIDGADMHPPTAAIDAMNSGTTIRIMTAVASLLDGTTVLTGDGSLRRRPMGPLLEALGDLGVATASEGGHPPVKVTGPMKGHRTAVRGDVSSQFISGLLMATPLKVTDTDITVLPPMKSEPYVEVTLGMLKEFGIEVHRRPGGYTVPGHQAYGGTSYTVPGDFSSAAFPLVAGAIAGGPVTVEGLDLTVPQGDAAILEYLDSFGVQVRVEGQKVTVDGGHLKPGTIDLSNTPDLFPILAVLASRAKGTTRLVGGEHLRFKESDRIATTVRFLSQMGATVEETKDGCVVHGGRPLRGTMVDSEGDHRILMAATVAGLVALGDTYISDAACYEVSYPSFLEDFQGLGASIEVVM